MHLSTTVSPPGSYVRPLLPRGVSMRAEPGPLERPHVDDLGEPVSLFPTSVAHAPSLADDMDSLAPTQRVAPHRSVAPPVPRRRWRPRPAMTEAIAGLGGFLLLITAITVPVAAFAGQGLTLALLLAVAVPPLAGLALLDRSRRATARQRAGLDEMARLLCVLSAALAVGLSVGGVAWVVHTEAAHALAVLEPVLVASAYSLVTAICAGGLGWKLRHPAR